jgi:hypothetical protein
MRRALHRSCGGVNADCARQTVAPGRIYEAQRFDPICAFLQIGPRGCGFSGQHGNFTFSLPFLYQFAVWPVVNTPRGPLEAKGELPIGGDDGSGHDLT